MMELELWMARGPVPHLSNGVSEGRESKRCPQTGLRGCGAARPVNGTALCEGRTYAQPSEVRSGF